MKILEAVVITAGTFAFAYACEWVLTELHNQFAEDNERMGAALSALRRHRAAVAKLVMDEGVSPTIKKFALDIAEMTTEQRAADKVVEWLEGGAPSPDMSMERRQELERLDDAISRLKAQNPEAWKELGIAVKSGIFAMLSQWPHISMRFRSLAELNEEDPDRAMAAAAHKFSSKKSDRPQTPAYA